jgi:hypothetical protein
MQMMLTLQCVRGNTALYVKEKSRRDRRRRGLSVCECDAAFAALSSLQMRYECRNAERAACCASAREVSIVCNSRDEEMCEPPNCGGQEAKEPVRFCNRVDLVAVVPGVRATVPGQPEPTEVSCAGRGRDERCVEAYRAVVDTEGAHCPVRQTRKWICAGERGRVTDRQIRITSQSSISAVGLFDSSSSSSSSSSIC